LEKAHRPKGPLCALEKAHRPKGPLCALAKSQMTTAMWRRTIRLTALLVLVNVALGLCACFGDAPDLPANGRGAALTNQTHRPEAPACGDDCDSCVCCASLVVTKQIRVEIVLTVSSKAILAAAAAPSDPEPHALKHPPRA